MADVDRDALAARGGTWQGSGHWRISEESIECMDAEIIDNINAQVREDDTLFHLGDWAFARKQDYYRRCRQYRDRIKCRDVILVFGNHDDRSIRDLFSATYDLTNIFLSNTTIVLCHYALAIWAKSHRQSLHLYGHSHGEAEAGLDQLLCGRRSMDVGVDNAARLVGQYRPFTSDEVFGFLGKRPGHSIGDHHHNQNQE